MKRQFFELHLVWIKYGLTLIGYVYFFGFTIQKAPILAFVLFSLIDLLPLFILHIQYYIRNKNSILTINRTDRFFIYKEKEAEKLFHFNEILFIKCITSYGNGKISPGWYSFGQYRYCKIGLKNHEEIIITSLMVPDIDQTLEWMLGIRAERVLKWLPLL